MGGPIGHVGRGIGDTEVGKHGVGRIPGEQDGPTRLIHQKPLVGAGSYGRGEVGGVGDGEGKDRRPAALDRSAVCRGHYQRMRTERLGSEGKLTRIDVVACDRVSMGAVVIEKTGGGQRLAGRA